MTGTIYDFIRAGENSYQKPIDLIDGWSWSMKDHIRKSFLYLNSQFYDQNDNRDLRPNKNIVLAILNVQYRTEGFDVKDIDIYIDNTEEYYKSFLAKKFHDKWAPENDIDTFIDDSVESYCTYGGVLVRNTNESRPEVIDLRSIAFCNQRNIIAYPFAIKHCLSASELRGYEESNGWGEDKNGATISIEDLITLCNKNEEKEIEVYEVHGTMPIEWLSDRRQAEESKMDINQIQVVAFYKRENGDEQGVTLFRKREPELPFKFLARDKIANRALGRGGVEELFESQQWTNWDEIKVTEMMEAASKVIHLTDDHSIASKHPTGLKNLDNNSIVEVQEGKKGMWQLDNNPRNLAIFNDSIERWNNHAQVTGSAGDTLLSGDMPSGVPFKLYEAKNIEDKSMHKYRQGKIAVFMDEIYRDWILPHFGNEITKDQKFLSELSVDEMQKVSEQVMTNATNRMVKEKILNGELVTTEEVEAYKQTIKDQFIKGGSKKFIEILKGEINKDNLGVMTNIAGKQKNLALMTDKLVNVMRQFIASPQIKQDPDMNKLLNVILESSGLSPIMFSAPQMMQQPAMAGNSQALGQFNQVNQQSNVQQNS